MVARVVDRWGRVDVLLPMPAAAGPTGRHQGEHDRSCAPRSCYRHEPVWHGLLLQRRRTGHEATTERQDHHGQLGCRLGPVGRRRLCALWWGKGRDRALPALPRTGPRPLRNHRELRRPGGHHDRPDHADGPPRQRQQQIATGPNWWRCDASGQSRIAPRWSSSWQPTSPTM
jgi:hypothetical protein